jgi:hypothetical protein
MFLVQIQLDYVTQAIIVLAQHSVRNNSQHNLVTIQELELQHKWLVALVHIIRSMHNLCQDA